MGRKKVELTKIQKINIKNVIETICKENGIRQNALADKIHCQPELVTRIKNGFCGMSDSTAAAIQKAFPDKEYPLDWLRGLTPYRTDEEKELAILEHTVAGIKDNALRDFDMITAVLMLLNASGIHAEQTNPLSFQIDGHTIPLHIFKTFVERTVKRTVMECAFLFQDYDRERAYRHYLENCATCQPEAPGPGPIRAAATTENIQND